MNFSWSLDLPLFGDARRFKRWLEAQLAKCHDEAFGRRFAKGCPVSGLGYQAYLHRLLEVGGETLLAGIRFKGGDVTKPFVDLLAWTGEPQADWSAVIAEAFSPFDPFAFRFCWSRDSEPPWSGEVDQYVYAGPAAGASHECVAPAGDLSLYPEFARSFERWQKSSPLGSEVCAAEVEALQRSLDEGHLVVAMRGREFLGLAACHRQGERAFEGWSMLEEFVVPEARGQGLGVALQRGLMRCLPAGELVWGTIHGDNAASQATAVRCGRERVETWRFASLVER